MTEPQVDSRLVEPERRAYVEERVLTVVSRYGGHRIVAGAVMGYMVAELADLTEELSQDGWLPEREWVPNDIEATGECCCGGCIGMGPCDREPRPESDDDRDDDCRFCPSDCQICSDTADCDCPTHGDDDA